MTSIDVRSPAARFTCRLSHLGVPSCILVGLLALFCGCTGVFGTIGWSLYTEGSLSFDAGLAKRLLGSAPVAFAVALVAFVLFVVAFDALKRRGESASPVSCDPLSSSGGDAARKKGGFFVGAFVAPCILRASVLIIVCWVPYIVLLFPGVLTFDSLWSILQCLGSGALPMMAPLEEAGAFCAHKPIVHTWLLGGFVLAGDAFGSQAAGVFAFVFLQTVATAVSLAVGCCYLARLGAPLGARRAALAFCALFPFIPIYSLSCFNDSMFAWLYVLWLSFFAEIVRTRAAVLGSVRNAVLFTVLSIGLALTKNPGVYLVAASIAILALIYRRELFERRVGAGFASAFLAPVLVSFVFMPYVVYPATGTVGTSSNEALGTLYQMTAAYVAQYDDEVTEEEREAIDGVLHYDLLAQTYDPVTQDPVKGIQRPEADSADLVRYLGVWLEMGVKHPETYIVAAGIVPLPFFCPAAEFTYYDDASPKGIDYYLEPLTVTSDEVQTAIDRLSVGDNTAMDAPKAALRAALTALHSLPVLGWALGLGFWASWIPLFFLVGAVGARRDWLPLCVPVLLSFALLLISPWAMSRYALPIVLTAPLMIGTLASCRVASCLHRCGRRESAAAAKAKTRG